LKDRFLLMEEADNRQISRELQGEVIGEFVYMVGDNLHLSYAGVRYAASILGGIHVKKVECLYNEALDQFEAVVYAENRRTGITLPGTAEHSASQLVDGETIRDLFARRTAVSKASRNALLAVMPLEHVKAVIVQLQESTQSLDSEIEIPVVIDSASIMDYLKNLGAPVDALEVTSDPHRNVVKVRPTRFLGSNSWCAIDNAIEKLQGHWISERIIWEVPR
jgi:hypothetical protein